MKHQLMCATCEEATVKEFEFVGEDYRQVMTHVVITVESQDEKTPLKFKGEVLKLGYSVLKFDPPTMLSFRQVFDLFKGYANVSYFKVYAAS